MNLTRETNNVKKFADGVMSANFEAIVIFPIYGQFRAIQKPDSGRIVKLTFSLTVNLVLQKLKTELKVF